MRLAILFLAIPLSALAQGRSATELRVADTHPQIDSLVRAKRWKELAALTDGLRSGDPSDSNVLYWSGISHLQLHEPVAAVQALRAAEKVGLNSALSHEGLGLAYYDLNQFGLFEEQMKKAAALDPRDAKPDYYLGLYRWTIRSDVGGALAYFEKAIVLQPDDWKSLYQAGNCEEQLGKLTEAKARYAQAIALLDKNGARFGWPYQGMARLLTDEDAKAALGFATKAVTLEPDEASNHFVLANVYQQLGNLPEATREFEIAVAKNPNDSKTRYALYKLYRQANDPRAAKELEAFGQIKALYDKD
ncbi:MAG TPA: tetratricopeptide repeat protein [Terriglobales bacterium]|nr:tetratricopeptide repeat protein [Terriglobales bacterium]